MSIAEFLIENGIDPSDPDSMNAYFERLREGHSDGAWIHRGKKAAEDDECYYRSSKSSKSGSGWSVQLVREVAQSIPGVNEISYNPQSRVISFFSGNTRINVYYTTQTIGTAKDGTQDFRRNCSLEQLSAILSNAQAEPPKNKTPSVRGSKGHQYARDYVCYSCGNSGHFAQNCPQVCCNLCGNSGHFAQSCPQVCCDLCGNSGHFAQNCPQVCCSLCGNSGHFAQNCLICKRCGNYGHFAQDCRMPVCYTCQKVGHIARNCHQPRVCYSCGEPGHFARDCHQNY